MLMNVMLTNEKKILEIEKEIQYNEEFFSIKTCEDPIFVFLLMVFTGTCFYLGFQVRLLKLLPDVKFHEEMQNLQ